jgi:hypothetical protein
MVIHGTNNLIKQSSSSILEEELCQLIAFFKEMSGKKYCQTAKIESDLYYSL